MTSCRDMRELISVSLDRALTRSEQARLDAHLVECPGCQVALREFRMVHQRMRSLASVEPPPWLAARIMARIQAEATHRLSFWQHFIRPLIHNPHYQVATLLLLCGTGYYLLKTHGSLESSAVLQPSEKPLAQLRNDNVVAPGQKPADLPSKQKNAKEEPAFAPPPHDAAALPESAANTSVSGAVDGLAEMKLADASKQAPTAPKPQAPSPATTPMLSGAGRLEVEAPPSAKSNQTAKKVAIYAPERTRPDAGESRKSEADSLSFVILWEPQDPLSAKQSLEKEFSRLGATVLAQPEGSAKHVLSARIESRHLPELLARLARFGIIREAPKPSGTRPSVITLSIHW